MPDRSAEETPGLREALWVSRCVGRAELSPLRTRDLEELAHLLSVRRLEIGEPLNHMGGEPIGVHIVKDGALELAVPGKSGRVVIQTLHPGDVDGDIQLLLDKRMPYETRAIVDTTVLVIERDDFDRLLATHPFLARRWLTSVAQRLARSHERLSGLLGLPLQAQVALLLLEEADGDVARLPQASMAAMVGARRPSVNRVLREFHGRGWVELAYRAVYVRDGPALAALARR